MTSSEDFFDPSPYQRIPNTDAPTGIALATQLLALLPKRVTPEQKNAGRKLKAALDELAEVFRANAPRPKDSSAAERRQADLRLDRAWSALFRRVEACSLLPAEYPESARAARLLEGFFSEGLGFLTLSFEAEWAESKRRLEQIDSEPALAKELEQLAGTLFLSEVRKAHEQDGIALGMTGKPRENTQAPSLDAPLRALRRAVVQYARATVATADEDEPETIRRVEAALEPIPRLREQLRRGQNSGTETSTPEPSKPALPEQAMSTGILWAVHEAIEVRIGEEIPRVRLGFARQPRTSPGPLTPSSSPELHLPAGLLPLVDPQGGAIPLARARQTIGKEVLEAQIVLPSGHPPITQDSLPGELACIPALWVSSCTEEELLGWAGSLGITSGLFIHQGEQVHGLGSSLGVPLFLQRLPRILLKDAQLIADNTDVTLSMGRLLEDFIQEFGSPEDALPHVRIATGYLYTRGLFRLLDLLQNPKIESLHILFSGKTDRSTARALTTMLEVQLQEGAEDSSPGVWEHFKQAALSQRLQVRVYPDAFLHAKLFLAYDKLDRYEKLQHSHSVIGSSNISAPGLLERGNLELNIALHNPVQNTELLRWFEGRWEEGCAPEPALLEILERQTPPAEPSFSFPELEQIYQAGLQGTLLGPEAHLALLASLLESGLRGLDPLEEEPFPEGVQRTIEPTHEQKVGVQALVARLRRARIAFLADSVGLGKTVTAIGTAWAMKRAGHSQRAVLIAPQKFFSQWALDLRQLGAPSDLFQPLNRHLLERAELTEALAQLNGADLLIVEEAHEALRSRNNKLWKLLREHLRHNLQARVLMLSATPWNNRREDILNYLLVAWNDGRLLCEHYPELNIPPLRDEMARFSIPPGGSVPASASVRWFEQLPLERYRQIFDRAFVQRTRSSLARRYQQTIQFPERIVHAHTVPSSEEYDRLFVQLKETLEQLFVPYREPLDAFHRAFQLLRGQPIPDGSNLRRSFLLQLYKRAESSIFALAVSLASVERRLENFAQELERMAQQPSPHAALQAWFNAESARAPENEEEPGELVLSAEEKVHRKRIEGLLDALDDRETKKLLRSVIDDQIASDLRLIHALRALIPLAVEQQAPKERLLDRLAREAHAQGHKPILIAVYADTALRTFLRLLVQCPDARIALALGGDEAWISAPSHQRSTLSQPEWADALRADPKERRSLLLAQARRAASCERSLVLAAFAPRARQTSREQIALLGGEIDILIGSEAIGVGQNLQDSTCLLHLDMPWNPMVLEQRIGRIDRRGGGRPDPAHEGRKIVDVHYCWSPAAVEQEVALRDRLREKTEGAVNDTNFDEVLLQEVRAHVEQVRAARHDQQAFAEEEKTIQDILDRQQRRLADRQEQVPGISGGSELDALRLLAAWQREHPGIPTPTPTVAAAILDSPGAPSRGGWLLTVAYTPISPRNEPLTSTPLLAHFAVPPDQVELPPPDMEILVRSLYRGGEKRARPGVGRGRWATALLALERALLAWGQQIVEAHNQEVQQQAAAMQAPAAQRAPSAQLQKLAVEARGVINQTLRTFTEAERRQLQGLIDKIKFLLTDALDPGKVHELLASRDDRAVQADLLAIRDLPRVFFFQDFDEVFDRLCGERWLSRNAAPTPTQIPLIDTAEGRWSRVDLRVLAATWCLS